MRPSRLLSTSDVGCRRVSLVLRAPAVGKLEGPMGRVVEAVAAGEVSRCDSLSGGRAIWSKYQCNSHFYTSSNYRAVFGVGSRYDVILPI